MLSLAVLISGEGSNLRALLESTANPAFPARVSVVGSEREAAGLRFARTFGVPAFCLPWDAFPSREAWGKALLVQLDIWKPDLLVLSGFMKLLPAEVVRALSPRILNTHPAYLPEFPGAHAVRDAIEASVTETGASVIVVDEGEDTGPVLLQERVAVLPDDTEETLHRRIKVVERRLLTTVLAEIAYGRMDLKEL
ncbi:MAG: phosphoribosylglycinamide formyltransferase [Cryobacterium sp.]|nr:phosphoribosylglycinamide formyltransferase [Cryobacterium sp.]MCC7127974.1 phosphoribosylglycinamide formyltransferase [Microbacteriaceae bacterium]MCO5294765.1 phosphoribosylglycinamide formyltransferase [Homoserinimonas sp.]MBX3089501.1 phosphoribosylglycinamide formyltransferase [Cryobacterium sp.]MBX3117107.1 phosphoribosylglycinamide formyltransferase [Cryobacterium sp.]